MEDRAAIPLGPVPDWTEVARDFPVNQHLLWLNNCGIAPPPQAATRAMHAHLDAYAARGFLGAPTQAEVEASITGRLARLLQCWPDELALIHNTNEGMTFLSHGLGLVPGDCILLLENEYPSNVYPWEHWRARGVRLDTVALGRGPDEFLANFHAALTPHTRVVSLSLVHWCTGMALPLSEVSRVCAERAIALVVDGSQGAGLIPVDLQALGAPMMAFSAWKWLLGPLGLGVLYVRRDWIGRLAFPWKGTGSVTDDERYLPYRETLKPTTARYVTSTPNFNDWIWFDASLAYLEGLGFPHVHARLDELGAHLSQALLAAGFRLAHTAFAGRRTAIVAAERDDLDAPRLVERLRARGVIAAARLGRLRLAPHVYQLPGQLDEAVRIIHETRSAL